MPRRVLNTKLLCVLLGTLFVASIVVHVVHGIQVRRMSGQLLDRAMQAEAAGNTELALDLLKRHLFFEPGDTNAMARYVQVLDHSATTPANRARLIAALERLVQKDPDQRLAERKRLATLLWQDQSYVAALKHINALLYVAPADAALLQLRGQCQEGAGNVEDAAVSYHKALEAVPGHIDVSVLLAALLRGPLQQSEEAGTVLDEMVRLNAGQARAWLERARALASQDQLDLAEADLAQARQRDPSNAEVLRASAQLTQARGQLDQARAFWRQGQEAHPDDLSFYLGLANLEALDKRPAEALRAVRQGLARPRLADDPDLLLALIDSQLTSEDIKGAEATLHRLRHFADRSALTDYLEGRLLMYRDKWHEAQVCLEKARHLAGPVLGAFIHVALARCHEHRGEPDQQLAAYEKALQLDPHSNAARLGLASTCAALGRTERALELYQQLAGLPQPPEGLWVPFARVLVWKNLALPSNQRDWLEVDKCLDQAAKSPDQAAQAVVVRAETLLARGKHAEAAALLKEAREEPGRKSLSDQAALWVASIRLQAGQGDVAGAHKLLADAPPALANRFELVREKVELASVFGIRSDPALAQAEMRLAGLTPAERVRLLTRLADIAFRKGDKAEGQRLWRKAVGEQVEVSERIGPLDLALREGDKGMIDAVVTELRRQEGPDGTWWRYVEAARRLAQSPRKPQGLAEAAARLEEIRHRRPEWSRAVLLGAELDELKGDASRALEGYEKAFDLGELGGRPAWLVERLAQLLRGQGRDNDADSKLRKYEQAGGQLSGDLLRLAAETALRVGADERAVALALRTLPHAGGDYRHYLWVGQFLLAADRPAEAEGPLRQAVALFEQAPEPWLALVQALVRTKKPAEADKTMRDMADRLPPEARALALAGCLETLGRFEEAHRHYQQALTARPKDATVLQRAIAFYLRMDKPSQAELLLRRLLDPSSPVEELRVWSRRELALILAFRGTQAAYKQAQALLDLNHKELEESVAEHRARALVRATQPVLRTSALREIEDLLKLARAPLDEQFRLVQLYESEGNADVARKHMLDLLDRDPANPGYLAHHIRNLLRQGNKEEAAKWLDDLERIEPGSDRVKQFRADQTREPDAR